MSRLPKDLEDLLAQLDDIEGTSFESAGDVELDQLELDFMSGGTSGGIGLILRQAYGDGGIHETD